LYLYDIEKNEKPWTQVGDFYFSIEILDVIELPFKKISLKNSGNTFSYINKKDDGNGIKITLINTGANKEYPLLFEISLFTNLDEAPIGTTMLWVEENSVEIELKDYEGVPLTKPGDYFIELGGDHFYTKGKSMAEFGIIGFPLGEDYKKLPKYNLKATGNVIDFQKEIIKLERYDL
jgi:hypothetical protein